MTIKRKAVKEPRVAYRAKRKAGPRLSTGIIGLQWAEVENATQPIFLEKDGQPVAVVLKYADYQRMNAGRAERRRIAWHELDSLLAQVHARAQGFSTEEIEADITSARQEALEQHHASRGRG
ncbi:MAG: hypothetical protein HY872_01585 [Chloroflexi bacterium]|nr:hypothetical protein [Chloroflexota bacterium]